MTEFIPKADKKFKKEDMEAVYVPACIEAFCPKDLTWLEIASGDKKIKFVELESDAFIFRVKLDILDVLYSLPILMRHISEDGNETGFWYRFSAKCSTSEMRINYDEIIVTATEENSSVVPGVFPTKDYPIRAIQKTLHYPCFTQDPTIECWIEIEIDRGHQYKPEATHDSN